MDAKLAFLITFTVANVVALIFGLRATKSPSPSFRVRYGVSTMTFIGGIWLAMTVHNLYVQLLSFAVMLCAWIAQHRLLKERK